jgi:enterobactin synthetase component D / holo-[acyl-carrier protein] synthase
VLERVLPRGVAFAESRSDVFDAVLFPEEEVVVEHAVEKRRREFATARHCARKALADLGFPAGPIPVGPRGAPAWPPGAVGSITHCDGYRGCAVAQAEDLSAIGIDAEPNLALPDGLLGDVALAEEARRLEALVCIDPAVNWDRLLFCMKEAVYKVWFPLAGSWLGFEDAAISIDPTGGSFEASLRVPGPSLDGRRLNHLSGRWIAADGLLLAAIALSAPAASAVAG